MGKIDRKFLRNVKVITGELVRNLVAVDVDKEQNIKQSGTLNVKNVM